MVAERRSAPKPRKKGRERRAEAAEKSARTVRNKLRETPGGGDFLGGGCRFWKFTESGGAAFEDLPAYAFFHMRIFSPFHGTGSALSEAVWRPAPEKNRQGSNRRRRKAQAEAGGRRRERKPSENTKERKYRQRGSGK